MKNITFRTSDYRYVGRKQIKGKRIVVYGKTQKECFKNLKQEIQNFHNPNKVKKSKTKIKFIDYFNKWYETEKEPFISESTKKDILNIKRKIEPLYELDIKKITKETIINFLKTLNQNRPKEKVIL